MLRYRTCDICDSKHYIGGFCRKHHERFKKHGDPLKTIGCAHDMSIRDRLMFYTEKTDYCWEWTGSKRPEGYGYFKTGGVLFAAHRASYTVFNGEIPSGMFVLHKCDNPKCINPEHLFLGSHADNMADMARKDRTNTRDGIYNNKPKLNEYDVVEIVSLHSKGLSKGNIAIKYGVTRQSIARVLKGKSWARISGVKSTRMETTNE